MGLDVPELDDRSFEQLMTDARKRIPVHSDTWTDHNRSDPGITMLETLAWVAESDIYQLDRVTDHHVRKYLRLLGVRPAKPQPSTVQLALGPPGTAGPELAAGTELVAREAGSGHHFATASAVTLTAANVAAVVSTTRGGRVDNTDANESAGLQFPPFGPEAAEGNAVYVGFDADPFDAGHLDLFVDYHDADLPAPAAHGGEDATFEPSATVEWSCYTGGGVYDPAAWQGPDQDRIADGTADFYYPGTISLPAPDTTLESAPLFDRDEPLYWLRGQVTSADHEIPPRVNAVRTRIARAVHKVRYRDERLVRVQEESSAEATRRHGDDSTTTTSQPGQEFTFARTPVLAASVTVGGTEWNPVEDFDASGPGDRDYVLDHERGVVRFGDGIRGEIPEPEQVVRAEWYDCGGGEAGNVGGDAEWEFVDPSWEDVPASALGASTGGADAESTDDALARLKADLRTPYRAVTAEDFRYLATHTPGLRFGRAAVDVEPTGDERGDCARHARVTVAVVPYNRPTQVRREASEGFLDAVACHLQQHRLLTDELVVEPPPYVPVDVETTVETANGLREAAITSALDQFLDPLAGFDGEGWPFGRPVYRSEVYEAIEGVAGVDCVVDVELRAGSPGTESETGIDVPGTALVYLDDADVTVADAGDRCGEWSP